MPTESEPRAGRWRPGLGSEWTEDERPYAVLLDALTREVLATEHTEQELNAPTRQSMADVLENQERAEKDELAESRTELATFRAALRDARDRGGERGQDEVPYDATQPRRDEQAGVLIQYLVRPGYAEVRTEEPAPGQHVYHLRIDWQRLLALAEEQGHPLTPA